MSRVMQLITRMKLKLAKHLQRLFVLDLSKEKKFSSPPRYFNVHLYLQFSNFVFFSSLILSVCCDSYGIQITGMCSSLARTA